MAGPSNSSKIGLYPTTPHDDEIIRKEVGVGLIGGGSGTVTTIL